MSLWEWANGHKDPDFVPLDKRTANGIFVGCIQPGDLVLTYEDSPDELKNLSVADLQKRLYKIREITSDKRMWLSYHSDARAKGDIQEDMKKKYGKGQASSISFAHVYPLLKIGCKEISAHLIFEGIDFSLSIDGEITFIEK